VDRLSASPELPCRPDCDPVADPDGGWFRHDVYRAATFSGLAYAVNLVISRFRPPDLADRAAWTILAGAVRFLGKTRDSSDSFCL
jgi:hypothetical protein